MGWGGQCVATFATSIYKLHRTSSSGVQSNSLQPICVHLYTLKDFRHVCLVTFF